MKKQVALSLMVLCFAAQLDAKKKADKQPKRAKAPMYSIVVNQETQKVPGALVGALTLTELTQVANNVTPMGEKAENEAMSLSEQCKGDVCTLEENEQGVFKTEEFSKKKRAQKKYVGTITKGDTKLGVFVKKQRAAKKAAKKMKQNRKKRQAKRQERRKARTSTTE